MSFHKATLTITQNKLKAIGLHHMQKSSEEYEKNFKLWSENTKA